MEDRALRSRDRDDNRRRHVGVYALYDLCWGGDDQWLYSASEDDALYGHDHGWYLPPTGPSWSSEELLASVDVPHQAPYPVAGLDRDEIDRVCQRLRMMVREELADVLRRLPPEWPLEDEELEVLGWFLEKRAHLRLLAAWNG